MKNESLLSKMLGKTNFSRRLKQFDGLTTDPTPLILRFTPLIVVLGSIFPVVELTAFRQIRQCSLTICYNLRVRNSISAVTAMKTKYKRRLNVDDTGIILLRIPPRLDKLQCKTGTVTTMNY